MCRTVFTNNTLCGHLSVENLTCEKFMHKAIKYQKRSWLGKLFHSSQSSCKQPDYSQTRLDMCSQCAASPTTVKLVSQRINEHLHNIKEHERRFNDLQDGKQKQSRSRNRSAPKDESLEQARRDARAAGQRYKNVPQGLMEEFVSLPGSDLELLQGRTRGTPPRPSVQAPVPQNSHPPRPGPAPTGALPPLPGYRQLSRSNANATRGRERSYSSRLPSVSRPSTAPQEPAPLQDQIYAAAPTRHQSHNRNQPGLWNSSRNNHQKAPVAPTQSGLWNSRRNVLDLRVNTNIPYEHHGQIVKEQDLSPNLSPIRVVDENGVSPFTEPGSPTDTYQHCGTRFQPQVRLPGDNTPLREEADRIEEMARQLDETEQMWINAQEDEDALKEAREKAALDKWAADYDWMADYWR